MSVSLGCSRCLLSPWKVTHRARSERIPKSRFSKETSRSVPAVSGECRFNIRTGSQPCSATENCKCNTSKTQSGLSRYIEWFSSASQCENAESSLLNDFPFLIIHSKKKNIRKKKMSLMKCTNRAQKQNVPVRPTLKWRRTGDCPATLRHATQQLLFCFGNFSKYVCVHKSDISALDIRSEGVSLTYVIAVSHRLISLFPSF